MAHISRGLTVPMDGRGAPSSTAAPDAEAIPPVAVLLRSDANGRASPFGTLAACDATL